jgi:hypothetical protein
MKARNRVSLNNWATVLKTNLFNVKEPSKQDDKKSAIRSSERKKGMNHRPKKSEEKCFCFTCPRDEVQDMRACVLCRTYVHEVCIGLTATDDEDFVCPFCEK